MLDTSTLIREAEGSVHRESFRVLEATGGYRVGAGVRIDGGSPCFFVEVLVTLCSGGTVDVEALGERVRVLRLLNVKGYQMRCEDSDGVICERTVGEAEVLEEIREVEPLLHR